MTITVVSKAPAGGRCTLYARYAEALSGHFELTVFLHCPGNDVRGRRRPPR